MGKRKRGAGAGAAGSGAGGGGQKKKRKGAAAKKKTVKKKKKKKKGKTVHLCTVCLYETDRKSSLTVHMRTHTGVKPYACNKCTYRAAQQIHLTRHMRSKHDTSSPSAAKAPATSKAKLRRCAEPFTLFKIHEFESKADSDCFAIFIYKSSNQEFGGKSRNIQIIISNKIPFNYDKKQ